ncbi:MAG: nucleotidyltransferase family protein [Bacteroidales bacterium]|nr:nucleotidyltransferase family protein [Bacteroidales bacterium]
MEIEQMREALLLLLRAGLGENIDTSLPDMTSSGWQSVLKLAASQNVLPIVYDGFKRYHEKFGSDCSKETKLSLFSASQQADKIYSSHLNAIQSLTKFFSEHGIRTMVLKGYALSLCYPNPSRRLCGDIDIYQFGDYKKADELVESYIGKSIDRTHHHHTVYVWQGITVENHYDFVNVHAHKSSARLERQFKQLAADSSECVGDVYLPSPNLHALFLLRHTGAHFAGESITLRHLLDWLLFCKKYGEEVDWEYIERCAKESGCDTFMRCLQSCCDRLMGRPYENIPLAERMWNDILQPEFDEAAPRNWRRIPFKARRWWHNRWKHRMVYSETLIGQLLTLTYSHIRRPKC